MGVVQRLQQFIDTKGISKYRFYQETGLSNGSLDKGENIGSDKCEKIIYAYPNLSVDWLMTGRGNMLIDEQMPLITPKIESITSDKSNFIRIPVVDISVAAGSGYVNPSYIEEVECISMPSTMVKDGKQYLCVRVKGQSMVPSIMDGGYLIIRLLDRSEWDSIRDNYVYVISDNEGNAYVKRLKNRLRQHGFIVCMSDNVEKQHYPNFNIYNEDLNTVWYAEWYFTAKIPNIQDTFYRKQAEFEDRLDELVAQFQQFTRTINMHNK
ncbi:S24 family peptidase [Parabacteroides provencensis]|uniref:S24 family peptidase n=1 Tax=Parabacteroides provencensis TaxID=1944636 RepID=UPI000C15C330|nr:S24 family peptidase [Parabacteroides provencensis]